ncbi:Structural maintenance of chromosomes protein 5 [Bagarius yarrelli]|uniref:Structural maintenance of chromosomes protein 5 n=1 Tax=Bagarius yarrelli TaxID=175774 RepID=A0A556VBI5_BAGYA|nr:Structural maintenance of chromosomes protein 5 [Bagarius yarrelli]
MAERVGTMRATDSYEYDTGWDIVRSYRVTTDSGIELLEATEKSVGPPEMYSFHCDLKNCRSKERDLENLCKEKANFLEKARQRNERNKGDVERYHMRRRHLDRIQMLEKKRPWVIKGIKQHLSLKQTEEADRQKWMGNMQRMIQDLQQELDNMSSQEDVTPKIEAVNSELRSIQAEKSRLEGERQDLRRDEDEANGELRRLQNRLSSLEDMMNRKEEMLRSRFRDTHTALLWLRRNRHLFQGNVYEPMMLVINVRDPRHAKYVESHVNINDLKAFVFQKQQDMEKFMVEVIRESQLRTIYTADERYTVKRSIYSNKTISSNSALRPSQFLSMTIDADERRQLEDQLRAAQQQIQSVGTRMNTNQEQQQMQQVRIDLQKVENEANARISAVNEQKVTIVKDLLHFMKNRARLSMEKVYLALDTAGLSAEKTKLESDCREGFAAVLSYMNSPLIIRAAVNAVSPRCST